MSYKVKLDLFEGPFELLIYLIEHSRMSVYDIKVAEITTQYLEHVEAIKEVDPELAQEFMVLAAELIEIKSRMLLPRPKESPDGVASEDPRAGLVQRILEYKQFRDMAGFLDEQFEIMSHTYTKPQEDLTPWVGEGDELINSSTDQFVKAFRAFLVKKQRLDEMKRRYDKVQRDRKSMEVRMGEISSLLEGRKTMMFSEMIKQDPSPAGRIITFMSLLEMAKRREIDAEQKRRYADIRVTKI